MGWGWVGVTKGWVQLRVHGWKDEYTGMNRCVGWVQGGTGR